MADEMRTILIRMRSGEWRRISDIPADAKITFGPMSPGKTGGGYVDRETTCLRIYTSRDNQLGVFVGVSEFRDEALTVQTKRITKKSHEFTDERTGEIRTVTDESETVEEWVDDNDF